VLHSPHRRSVPHAFCAAQGREASEVLQRVLRNILVAPGEAKYRRLRLRNKRIQEAVVDVAGGVELLQVRAPPAGFNGVCPAAMYPRRESTSCSLSRRLEAARLVLSRGCCIGRRPALVKASVLRSVQALLALDAPGCAVSQTS